MEEAIPILSRSIFKSLEPKKFRIDERQFDPLVEELAGPVCYNAKISDDELLKNALTKNIFNESIC